MSRLAFLTLALIVAAVPGCSTLSEMSAKANPFADHYVRADQANPAVEVACIWQPGEGRNDRGLPARGFSGQVFFFTGRDSEPAIVDGTMRVYLFADRGTPEERAKPLKQFDFSPEAWTAHGTKTSLGPGYSVFIPYPSPEPYQVRCQLRARFTPRQGPVIWSEAVAMTLEGPPRPGNEPLSMAGGGRNAQSLPTIVDARLTHRRTSAQDISKDAAGPETRRLRTDTFRLGEIEQTGYEAPGGKTDATIGNVPLDQIDTAELRQMLKAANERKPSASHPLSSGRDEAAAAAHPFAEPAPVYLARPQAHSEVPAAMEPSRPEKRISLVGRYSPLTRRHPLGAELSSAASDATAVRAASHPLTRPARETEPMTGEPSEAASPNFGAWAPMEK